MSIYVYNPLNIKIIRTKYNLTNNDLARILGKHLNTIIKYNNGTFKLSAEQIAIICNAVHGVTPIDFFDVIDK